MKERNRKRNKERERERERGKGRRGRRKEREKKKGVLRFQNTIQSESMTASPNCPKSAIVLRWGHSQL